MDQHPTLTDSVVHSLLAGGQMAIEESLCDVTQKIVEAFHPEKVILFGSHAYGVPTPNSDVDLLVIMESDQRPADRSIAVTKVCRPRFWAMDILVHTPEEIAHRLDIGDPFFKKIVTQGEILYERPAS